MNLSKSKYCNGITCNKMLWLKTYKPEVEEELNNDNILNNGTEVGGVAKNLFGKPYNIEFNEDLTKMIEETEKAINMGEHIITEASFVYNDNFCSIDILKCNGKNIEIYEVKSATEINDIYLDDISYQVYILLSLGYNVTKASIVYINNKYERKGELELDKLFNIEDVTDIAYSKQEEVEDNINTLTKYMKQTNEPTNDIGICCMKPYSCPFFKYCTKHLPSNNIFSIRGMPNTSKFKLYYQGLISYEDLLLTNINPKYKQQIEYTLYNKNAYIDKQNIKDFISTLSYPMYFSVLMSYQQMK